MMKKRKTYLVIILCMLVVSAAQAQTNTFPSSGNVGIGTTSPGKKVEISSGSFDQLLLRRTETGGTGVSMDWINSDNETAKIEFTGQQRFDFEIPSGIPVMSLTSGGDVGIGTSSPKSLFDVHTSEESGLMATFLSDQSISEGTEVHRWTLRMGRDYDYPNRTLDFGMVSNNYGQYPSFYVAPEGVEVFRVNYNGNVGIGTTSPEEKLTVAGTGKLREVIVEVDAGADYVFEEDYDLPSLKEVERFIQRNKHLPEIAPASEMTEEGVKVGELQMQLLQKIEELTLYVIDLKKENKAMKQRIEQLESQN